MSIKKTWFSYILWLIATGFTVIFTYSYIVGIVKWYGLWQPDTTFFMIAFSAAFIFVAGVIYFLINWLRKELNIVALSKKGKRGIHFFVLSVMAVFFVTSRCMVLFGTMPEEVAPTHIFEAAKIMPGGGIGPSYAIHSVFEKVYVYALSGLFLFLGNKMEIIFFLQIILQTISFWLLVFIGKTLQKRFYGWVPAIVYVFSPYSIKAVVCLDADNFWFFIVLSVMALVCLMEKVWKHKAITYVWLTLTGIIFSIFSVLDAYPGMDVLKGLARFGGYERFANGTLGSLWEFLILLAFVVFYCISFWRTKVDNVSAYIFPIVCLAGIIYFKLGNSILMAIFMLLRLYMSFLAAEGLRILFKTKTNAVTELEAEPVKEAENKEAEKAIVSEEEKKDEILDSKAEDAVFEETGVIRVSDILKAANAEGTDASKADELTETLEDEVIDKTAMIENVLPMPKKHVARSFEYAFEPTEDMMHYDIEIENDDYDYE